MVTTHLHPHPYIRVHSIMPRAFCVVTHGGESQKDKYRQDTNFLSVRLKNYSSMVPPYKLRITIGFASPVLRCRVWVEVSNWYVINIVRPYSLSKARCYTP